MDSHLSMSHQVSAICKSRLRTWEAGEIVDSPIVMSHWPYVFWWCADMKIASSVLSKEIDTCSHVCLRRIAIAPPLTAPYDGRYKVIVRSDRVMKILIKGKVETVSLDRVNPALLECEPETGKVTQSKTQLRTMNSKITEIVRGIPKDQIKPSSALTQKFDRKRAKSTANTQTRSDAFKIGKNLATTPQRQAHRVNLPKQFTPYLAPHSRIPVVSRANGSSGGLRTYSRVPLHLRGKTPNTTDTTKTSNVRNNSNIADGDKIVPDATVKQTRAGQKIHTPARFVLMVIRRLSGA